MTRRMRRVLPGPSCCNRVVIDGHNDVLTRLHDDGAPDDALLTEGAATITVPSARAGGLAAGLFAVLPPVPGEWPDRTEGGWDVPYHPSVPWEEAARTVGALGARLQRLLRACDGAIRLVRDTADLDACLNGDALGVIFHMEGAEAIDTDLDALEVWYAAGLRSLGPVWSRANAFGSRRAVPLPGHARHRPGPDRGRRAPRAALRRARHRRRPQPPQHRRVLGRRPRARRPADRLALLRPRAVPVDAQPDRRPARRDRRQRRAGRHQLRHRVAARGGRRRSRHPGRADRRARALRGRPLRGRPRGARLGLRRRDDARRGRGRLRPAARAGGARGRRVRAPPRSIRSRRATGAACWPPPGPEARRPAPRPARARPVR